MRRAPAYKVPGDTVFVGRHTSGVSARFVAELTNAPVAWVALSPIQVMAVPVAAHTYGSELAGGFDEIRAGLGLPPMRDSVWWFADADAEIALWPSWFDVAGHSSPRRIRLTDFPLADHPAVDAALPDLPWKASMAGARDRRHRADAAPDVLSGLDRGSCSNRPAGAARGAPPRSAAAPPTAERSLVRPSSVREGHAVVVGRRASRRHRDVCPGAGGRYAAGALADGIYRPDNAARLSRHGLPVRCPSTSGPARRSRRRFGPPRAMGPIGSASQPSPTDRSAAAPRRPLPCSSLWPERGGVPSTVRSGEWTRSRPPNGNAFANGWSTGCTCSGSALSRCGGHSGRRLHGAGDQPDGQSVPGVDEGDGRAHPPSEPQPTAARGADLWADIVGFRRQARPVVADLHRDAATTRADLYVAVTTAVSR